MVVILPPLVLLDFDGVMVDTEVALFTAWREEYARHDLLLTSDAWAASRRSSTHVGEVTRTDVAEALVDRAGGGDAVATRRRVRRRYESVRDRLAPRPGIEAWLAESARAGTTCALVTDADEDVVAAFLNRNGLATSVAFVVARGDGPGKPDPETYRRALALAGRRPEEAIAVEDSVRGILAARAAGLRVLAVPHKATGHTLRPGPDVAVVDPRFMTLRAAMETLAPSPGRAPVARPDAERRLLGSMAGLALGDALGKLLDKRPPSSHDRETRQVCTAWTERDHDAPEVLGGRVTDDTIQSLAVAAVLASGRPAVRTHVEGTLRRMNPHGGRQVYKLKAAASPAWAADGTTNGSVPRSSALGWGHTTASWGDLVFDAVKVSTLTHAGSNAVGAAVLQSLLVSGAVDGRHGQPLADAVRAMLPAIGAAWPGADRYVACWHDEAARWWGRPADAAELVFDLVERHGLTVEADSSALVAQVLAVTDLAPYEVFEALLRTPTGGDLDSTMAIYGAVSGAVDPTALPSGWSERALTWAWIHGGLDLPARQELVRRLILLRERSHG